MTDDELQPKSGRRTWLIVLLAIGIPGLLIVVCCGGLGIWGWFAFKDLGLATISGTTFVTNLTSNQVDSAYKSTTANFQANMTLEQFRELIAKNPTLTSGGRIQITNPQMVTQPGSKKATMNATVSSSAGSVTCTITLTQENEIWKVDGFTVP